jgi:hypothetical protein
MRGKFFASSAAPRAIRVLAAGVSMLLAAVSAAQADGWYAALGAGWSAPSAIAFRIDSSAASASGKLRLDDNVSMDVAAGYGLTIPVRLEGELLLSSFDSKDLNLGNGSVPNRLSGRADINTLFANGLYDIPLSRILTLSLGGGVGAARFSPIRSGIA